jgi:hypothetical protein
MLRNLSVDCFVILVIFGFFRFIPNYILVLIIFACFFDSFALYFNGIGSKITNKNPALKQFVTVYLKYTKPLQTDAPVLFFLDRIGAATIFGVILIYYWYLHGFC